MRALRRSSFFAIQASPFVIRRVNDGSEAQELREVPVLGHAFVGITTAVYTRPAVRREVGAALWMPVLVGLAYLPDITAQLASLAGLGRWRTASHSIVFAGAAAVLLAWPVARLARMSRAGAGALVLLSVLGHDLLDILAGTDCRPFWPFSLRQIDLPNRSMANGLAHEVAWFGGACAALVVVRMLIGRWWRRKRGAFVSGEAGGETLRREDGGGNLAPAGRPAGRRMWVLAGYVLTGAVLALAAGTHYLYHVRQRQMAAAWKLIWRGRGAEAFPLIEQAQRWPRPGGTGMIDFAWAEAYLATGDRERAERHFLAALRERPENYFILVDLALFYATAPEPAEVRRQRVEPLVATLRKRYSNWRDLPRRLAQIEAQLNRSSTRSGQTQASRAGPRRK